MDELPRGRPLVLALLLAGCPGAVPAPSGASVEQLSFNTFRLQWTPPSGSVDGYEIQGQAPGRDWTPLHDGLIPGSVTAVDLSIDDAAPELVHIGLRLRATKGGSRSDWATTGFQRGIRPPTGFTATATLTPPGAHIPPILTTWQNRSQVATELKLERASSSGPGPGTFVELTDAGFGITSYVDDGPTEGTWQYRLSYGTRGIWSLPVLTQSDAIDVAPPVGLTVRAIDGGVRLDWTPRSTATDHQFVNRFDPGAFGIGAETTLATLPPDAGTYLDATGRPWPAASYRVTVSTGMAGGSTPLVPIGHLIVSGPIQLEGSSETLPRCTHVARSDQGLLHAADYEPSPTTLYRDTASGWEAHPTAWPVAALGGLTADSAGHLHSVYSTPPGGAAANQVIHEWHDGTAWLTETVTVPPNEFLQSRVTPEGTVHVLVQRREVSGAYTPVHLAGSGGTFASKDLIPTVLPPPPSGSTWGCVNPNIDVARDGTAWAVLSCFTGGLARTTFVLFRRSPEGTWTEELVPFGDPVFDATVIAGRGDSAALLVGSLGGGGVSARKVYLRSALGWGPEEHLSASLDSMEWRGAALLPDGQTLAALLNDSSSGMWLSIRTPAGWSSLLLGTPAVVASQIASLEQTGDGRVVITVPHGLTGSGGPNTSVFVETP